jgi:hypothetical protein
LQTSNPTFTCHEAGFPDKDIIMLWAEIFTDFLLVLISLGTIRGSRIIKVAQKVRIAAETVEKVQMLWF